MSQQVQELIDKIKIEGIQVAEEKAKDIERRAKEQTQKIIQDAQREAEHLLLSAKEEVKRTKESAHTALQQSARDMMLTLRKEIENILQGIIRRKAKETLTTDTLKHILGTIIKDSLQEGLIAPGVVVSLSQRDWDVLREGFLTELQKQLKQPVKFSSAQDIDTGFMISFDEGKSNFDFTDEGLAGYLGSFLNSHVRDILKESISSHK